MKFNWTYLLLVLATAAYGQPPDESDLSSVENRAEVTIPSRCQKPDFAAEIPDGTTSSASGLLAVQAQIQEFAGQTDDYIACVNEAFRIAGNYTTKQYADLKHATISSAQSVVDEVATAFRDQVAAFRVAGGANGLRRPPPVPLVNDPERCRL